MKKHRTLVSSILVYTALGILLILASLRPNNALQSGDDEAFDSPDEAQKYYLQRRVPNGATSLPMERYVVANEQLKKMSVYSTATNSFALSPNQGNLGSWIELGPGNIGGRTRALLIEPNTPNIMYAGGVAGGIWKTTDAGLSWIPKGDLLPNLSISSLARGTDGRLYAGTGETNAGSNTGFQGRGLGIYVSTSSGETWNRIPGTETADFHQVDRVVISPSNPRIIYAATNSGLWQIVRKKNKEIYQPPIRLPIGTFAARCRDVAIRTDQPSSPDSIVVALYGSVWRSIDGGATWSEKYNSGSGNNRIAIAIAPSNQNYIYAMSESNGQLNAVLKSTDGGGSWTPTVQGPFNPSNLGTYLLSNPFEATYYGYRCRSNPYHQGWYDMAIAVDPKNPEIVWAGGINLFRSDNGGVNWGMASFWFPGHPQYVHADQHIIVFPSNYHEVTNPVMFVGNDGGIFKTENARSATVTDYNAACSGMGSGFTWTSRNNGYGVTQFYHGLPQPGGTTYFGGTQDNGTVEGTDGSGVNGWQQRLGGDGGYVAITPNGSTRYAEFQFGRLLKDNGGGFYDTGSIPESLPFITVFVMDPNNSERLWLGGASMWRTDDGASNWSQAHSTPMLDNKEVRAIAVCPGNSNRVFAGTLNGNIFYTDNGNATPASQATWTKINFLRAFPTVLSGIAFDPNNTNTIYVTYSNFKDAITDHHIYKSTNGGQTWVGIDGNGAGAIPDIPVNSIVVDPTNSQRLYIGTDVGAFVSVDGGNSWSKENTGFANAPIEALSVGTRNGVLNLYAFTHGRGAWRVPLGSSGGGGSPPTAPSDLQATAISSSQINLTWQDNSNNETGFRIERGTDGVNFSFVANAPANQTSQASYSNTGLAANTRYYYRVKALHSTLGDSGFSNVADATTLQAGSPPVAPTLLSATASSSMQIDLSWQHNGVNVDGFRIERKQGSAGSYERITTRGAGDRSYSDATGLQPSTLYYYRIQAYSNAFGNSPYSAETSATTSSGGGGGGGNPCVTVSLLSGSGTPGYAEGVAGGAMWNGPTGGAVAKHPVSGFKTLFIADTDNQVIRLVYLEGPNAGKSEWIAGAAGSSGYKGGSNPNKVRFSYPRGIAAATDINGNLTALIIADTNNHVIRKILPPTSTGALWTPQDFVGTPTVPGNDATHFSAPQAVTVTSDGFIYVADTDNNLIRKVSPQGTVSTLVNGSSYGMVTPTGITANQSGQLCLYVADTGGNAIWKVTAAGTPTKIAGSGSAGFQDGTGLAAQFNKPYHLAYCNTSAGEMLLIADRSNHRYRKLLLASSVVSTLAGSAVGY